MRSSKIFAICFLLSGCQTTEENYSSPTFTFPSDARSSKGALALQFSEDGWKIESETDSTIVFRTSRFDSGIGGILVTCGSCRQPEVELLIIAAPNGNKTTIRYDLTWIINPKSPREDRITPRGPKGKISNAVEAQIELARKRVGAAGRISSR